MNTNAIDVGMLTESEEVTDEEEIYQNIIWENKENVIQPSEYERKFYIFVDFDDSDDERPK